MGAIVNAGSVSSLDGGWPHAGYNAVKADVTHRTLSIACGEG